MKSFTEIGLSLRLRLGRATKGAADEDSRVTTWGSDVRTDWWGRSGPSRLLLPWASDGILHDGAFGLDAGCSPQHVPRSAPACMNIIATAFMVLKNKKKATALMSAWVASLKTWCCFPRRLAPTTRSSLPPNSRACVRQRQLYTCGGQVGMHKKMQQLHTRFCALLVGLDQLYYVQFLEGGLHGQKLFSPDLKIATVTKGSTRPLVSVCNTNWD